VTTLPLLDPSIPDQAIFRSTADADPQQFFPTEKSQRDNKAMAVAGDMVSIINPADPQTPSGAQILAYYVYSSDERTHNITDWAVEQFRRHYGDVIICQSDIFYYVYAVLHHPAYRQQNAGSQPGTRAAIPFAPDFWKFSDGGRALTALHLTPGDPAADRVETERLAAALPGNIGG
jgi:predicted helicase